MLKDAWNWICKKWWWNKMVEKEFMGVEYVSFNIQSDDKTFNETITVKKLLVDKIKECISFLNSVGDDSIEKYHFQILIELCLISGVEFVSKNKESIIDTLNDDSFISYAEFYYNDVIGGNDGN